MAKNYFAGLLLCGDRAQNVGNWQWIAGSGVDAAPYFRIFNPVSQAKKRDPQGKYLRRWIPELRDVPDKFVHCPHLMEAPPKNYAKPMIDLDEGRDRFKSVAKEFFAAQKRLRKFGTESALQVLAVRFLCVFHDARFKLRQDRPSSDRRFARHRRRGWRRRFRFPLSHRGNRRAIRQTIECRALRPKCCCCQK